MPANLFVVPMTQPIDSAHFHSLSAAVATAATGDVVTIEPGASPDYATGGPVLSIDVKTDGITIQGDPNVPASILPIEHINVIASNVQLVNLNLSIVTLGIHNQNYTGNSVSKCLIYELNEYGSNSRFTQNTIAAAGSANSTNDYFANNTFNQFELQFFGCNNTIVTQNTFYGDNVSAISLLNCGGNGTFTVSNNTIVLTNANANATTPIGISVKQSQISALTTSVDILNNTSSTGSGVGLSIDCDLAPNLVAKVQGNDFHNNAIGVLIKGDASNNAPNIDLGGGSLGSLGGNNFRGFQGPATSTSAAISISNAGNGIGGNGTPIPAEQNMFPSGVAPSQLIYVGTGGGSLATDQVLSDQRSYVQMLYHNLLGRIGTLAELDGWVSVLNNQGQAAVTNGILRSSESLGRVVDSLYLRFLGRQADAAGRPGWITAFQNGATLESIETAFLTAPEYLHHIDTDYVQSLYINTLGRTGNAFELAFWDNQIQRVGLAGIANAFVLSQESRDDNVSVDFQTFLHRRPKANELSAFAALPGDLLTLEATVLSSQEAFING